MPSSSTTPSDKPFAITNIRTYVPLTLSLDELNYDAWRELFEACCISFSVHDHLVSAPPATPSEDWKKLDALVKLWILGTLHQSLIQMVLKKGASAHSIWDSLENLFRDNKDTRGIQLDQELRTMEIGDMSVTEYCRKLKVLSDLLANIEQPVSEKHLVMYMLNGPGDKFDQIANIIRHQKPLPSFLEAHSMLTQEETRLLRLRPSHGTHRDTSSAPTVLYTSDNSNQSRENNRNSSRKDNNRNFDRRGNGGGNDRRNGDRRGNDRRQQQSDRRQPTNQMPTWQQWALPPPWAPHPHWVQHAYAPWADPPRPPTNWVSNKPFNPSQQQTQHGHQAAAVYSAWPTPPSNSSNMGDQATNLPEAFQTMNLQDPLSFEWFMDTGATNHLSAGPSNPPSSSPM